jgi:ParB/RepB/Spo0J family partition protein
MTLERLSVEWVPIDSIKPNKYNPNRQDKEVFDLLKKSIQQDGFTQPVIVRRDTNEIVDGEHRWRALKELDQSEVPVVFVDMSDEQMRVATLRHNRARGEEDFESVVKIINEIQEMGALEWAQDSLLMSEEDINEMLNESIEAFKRGDEEEGEEDYGGGSKKLQTCPRCGHEF